MSIIATLATVILLVLAVLLVKFTDLVKVGGAIACASLGFSLASSPIVPLLGQCLVFLASLAHGAN